MSISNFLQYLEGGDLRSIAGTNEIVRLVNSQSDFDALFKYLFFDDRRVVMRTADAIEKITLRKRDYLIKYRQAIIELMTTAVDKELKWHLALMSSRLVLSPQQLAIVWNQLRQWAEDKKESRIVRVNSIQALFELSDNNRQLSQEFDAIVQQIATENIPSINARLKKLTTK